MLLQSPAPKAKRVSRRWPLMLAGGLLGLSIIAAGVGLKAVAAPPAEPKKEEPRKEELKGQPNKEQPKKNKPADQDPREQFPDFFKQFDNVPGVEPEMLKHLREEMERTHAEMRRAMEMARQMQGGQFRGGMLMPQFAPLGQFGRQGPAREGRLGARVEKPSETLVEQLDLPQGQGLVVDEVRPDSAASKAGLKAHDILLEVNGKAVSNDPHDFVKQVDAIKANTPVEVVLLRKGKKETLKGLTLPEAKVEKPAARGGFGFDFPFDNAFPGNFPGQFGGFQFGGFGPGGKPVLIQTSRNGDEFTATRKEGDLTITVKGKVEDGKAVPGTIEIDSGNGVKKYESVEKVPEEHRDAVKALLRIMTGQRVQRGGRQRL